MRNVGALRAVTGGGAVVATVLTLLLSLVVTPAHAAASAAASIVSGDVLSGQATTVTVRVTNTGTTGGLLEDADSSIDAISIEVPNDLFTDDTVAVAPAGWSAEFDPEIGFVFAFADSPDDAIAPSASLDLSWTGTAARIADDTTAAVPVFVSDDGGITLTSAGTPTLTSRILELVTASVAKPATAVNQDASQVTAGQTTADLAVTVVNHGLDARTVEIDVAQTAGGSSVATTAATPTIPGGSTAADVLLDATFGAEGSLTLEATATAIGTDSVAVPLDMGTVAVQRAFRATYVEDSISPSTAVQGEDVAFSVEVDKVGAQPATLHAYIEFGSGFRSYRSPAVGRTQFDFGAGDETGVVLTFPERQIDPGFPNGTVQPRVVAGGVDANGATISNGLVPDVIVLDRLLPVVDLVADVGPSEVTGADPAAGDGRPIVFSGDVWIDATEQARCTDCTLDGPATLDVRDDAGDPLASFTFPLTIEDGVISGEQPFTFPAGASSASATVRVLKVTGAGATATTDEFDVDVVAPFVREALTQRGTDEDSLLVTMSEPVDASGTTAADWTVDGNIVTEVEQLDATRLRLTLAQRFAGRNTTPWVTYDRATLNGPVFDRVALDLVDVTLRATDGIAPRLPTILQVQELGRQDEAFWTNQQRPTITITSVDAGDLLSVWWDLDDDGVVGPADRELTPSGGDTALGTTHVVTPVADLQAGGGPSEEGHALLVVALDEAGNRSDLADETLNVDTVGPALASFSVDEGDGNAVTVRFTEPVPRGRDAAFDWTVFAEQDGVAAYRTVTEVTFVSPTERRLTVAPSSYDPTAGPVLRARLKSRAAPSERYEDRATNRLAADETANAV